MSSELCAISDALARDVDALRFGSPTACVYNPLVYARAPHHAYLERYGAPTPREILLLGMNPGPFGMAQTGVPFGDVAMVRDWMGIEARVERPEREHVKRPVLGFSCPRGEVSGARLWGWARDRFGAPEGFFARFFVANYCPLAFMTETGANRTPDKLPAEERRPLFEACDVALRGVVAHLRPRYVLGVGHFAETRAREALSGPLAAGVIIGRIPHPSPASPAANRGWAQAAETALRELDVKL